MPAYARETGSRRAQVRRRFVSVYRPEFRIERQPTPRVLEPAIASDAGHRGSRAMDRIGLDDHLEVRGFHIGQLRLTDLHGLGSSVGNQLGMAQERRQKDPAGRLSITEDLLNAAPVGDKLSDVVRQLV